MEILGPKVEEQKMAAVIGGAVGIELRIGHKAVVAAVAVVVVAVVVVAVAAAVAVAAPVASAVAAPVVSAVAVAVANIVVAGHIVAVVESFAH